MAGEALRKGRAPRGPLRGGMAGVLATTVFAATPTAPAAPAAPATPTTATPRFTG